MAVRYDVSITKIDSLGSVHGDMAASPISSFGFPATSSGGFTPQQPSISAGLPTLGQ